MCYLGSPETHGFCVRCALLMADLRYKDFLFLFKGTLYSIEPNLFSNIYFQIYMQAKNREFKRKLTEWLCSLTSGDSSAGSSRPVAVAA